MAIDLPFRSRAVRTLINDIGCYVLCDLDQVPIYVGQSVDGISSRVNRHLTSARSDIIANRQIDVWEIAWVWAYPGKGQSGDQLPRRRIVSRVSRTFSPDERQGAEAADRPVKVAGAIAKSSGDVGR
jgi:hypothetical protein